MTIKLVQGSPPLLYCVYIVANLSSKYANGSSLTASLVGLNSWIPSVETLCHVILNIFMSLWGCVCLISRYCGMSICREGSWAYTNMRQIFSAGLSHDCHAEQDVGTCKTCSNTKDNIFKLCLIIWEFGKMHMVTITSTKGCVCWMGRNFIIKLVRKYKNSKKWNLYDVSVLQCSFFEIIWNNDTHMLHLLTMSNGWTAVDCFGANVSSCDCMYTLCK